MIITSHALAIGRLHRFHYQLFAVCCLSTYTIDIYRIFDKVEDGKFEYDVKTGTGRSFVRHFTTKPVKRSVKNSMKGTPWHVVRPPLVGRTCNRLSALLR